MRAAFLCVALMVVPTVAMAQAYKCKGRDGKTSFQDQPCEQGSTGGPVFLSDPSPSSGTPQPTLKGKAPPARRDKVPDSRKGAADDALIERNRQLEAQNRAVLCGQARRNLSVLQLQRPVFSVDKNGNKVYVDDANRQAELAAAQQQVTQDCS